MAEQELTIEEARENFFGILDNEDMEIVSTQVVALSVTINAKMAEVIGNKSASMMDYTSEAVDIWIAIFREIAAMERAEMLDRKAAIAVKTIIGGKDSE